ncbi:MAG: hypothetical protein WCF85_04315 [Rhodospirillaceae bacterium]
MRFTIKARLATAFAVVLILGAASAYLGIHNLHELNIIQDGVIDGPVTRSKLVLELDNELGNLAVMEKNALLETDSEKT